MPGTESRRAKAAEKTAAVQNLSELVQATFGWIIAKGATAWLTAPLELAYEMDRGQWCMGTMVVFGAVPGCLISDDLAAGIHDRERCGRHGAGDAGDALLLRHGQFDFRLRARKQRRFGNG